MLGSLIFGVDWSNKSGIGRGIAMSLARDGAAIVVNYQKDSKSAEVITSAWLVYVIAFEVISFQYWIQAVVAAITSVKGGRAIAIQADVSITSDVDRLFSEAKRVYGRIDIVVANSGVAFGGSIAMTSNDDIERILATNYKGVFYTLRTAAYHVGCTLDASYHVNPLFITAPAVVSRWKLMVVS
jgi:3-oxoacyl-[acyl-carrier protein] reductase